MVYSNTWDTLGFLTKKISIVTIYLAQYLHRKLMWMDDKDLYVMY